MPLSKQQIAEHLVTWRPLVVGWAYKFRRRLHAGHDIEDIVAIGMVALWRAAQTFDENAGAKFATYANRCVMYAFLNEVKMLNTSNRRVAYHSKQSLDEEHPDGKPVLTPRNEQYRDPEAALLHAGELSELNAARRTLPEKQNWLIRERFDRERTLKDIGVDLGTSREWARQLEVIALKRLRVRLEA